VRLPRVSRLIECRASSLFALVADVEAYPEFMPGWRGVRVLARREGELAVEQLVGAGPWLYRLQSVARLAPPHAIEIRGQGGPFTCFAVQWQIVPEANAARASLQVECELSGPARLALLPLVRAMPARAMSALAVRAQGLH